MPDLGKSFLKMKIQDSLFDHFTKNPNPTLFEYGVYAGIMNGRAGAAILMISDQLKDAPDQVRQIYGDDIVGMIQEFIA